MQIYDYYHNRLIQLSQRNACTKDRQEIQWDYFGFIRILSF